MPDKTTTFDNVFCRCMRCWSGAWLRVDVTAGYPQTVQGVCPQCHGLRAFTPTGRLQPLRTAGALRHLQTASKNRVEPLWDQLSLPMPQDGLPPADQRVERENTHTPTPAETRIRKGSGSTRPRHSPAE